jgi:predicted enzyme related to lactoylglutathione lyase
MHVRMQLLMQSTGGTNMVGVEIVLACKDLDKAVKFYKEQLGFRVVSEESEKDFVTLEFAENSIMLEKDKLYKEALPELKEELERNQYGVGTTIFIHVDDADRRYRDIKAKGVKMYSEIATKPWGAREFVIKDPEGYMLNVHAHI